MPESDAARDAKANALAEKRGEEAAKLAARLDDHERRLVAINGSVARTADELHSLKEEVRRVAAEFATATAVAAARAADFQRATENQVSTRTFVVSLILAVLALGGLIAGLHP